MANVTDKVVRLKVEVKIKFRAAGITFGNFSETKLIDLPKEVQWVAQFVHFSTIAYNDHGVSVIISLA